MRALFDIFAGMIFFAGLVIMALAFLTIWQPILSGFFWLGAALALLGFLLYRESSRKTCPQCAERVKYEAKKCRHCGHEFPAPASSSFSEPFYK